MSKSSSNKGGCIAALFFGLLVVVFAVYLAVADDSDNQTATDPNVSKTTILSKDQQCLQDLECVKQQSEWLAYARVYCRQEIEAEIENNYDYRWIDGNWGYKFFVNKLGYQSVYYAGDKMQLRKRNGGWQTIIYECQYDPLNETVLGVRWHPVKS